ncbi:MAG: TIGR03088 family PEP-CTERM/XrtA system glycosyltransferase [Gammaproteobacteria bacterium]|nr:TIGR03088 family PEP-CTERM/XrtA system glycosyltransferase [Gammaproteobacteria bacterium]
MNPAHEQAQDRPALVAHILYRFAVGGLENGVVNLINRLPAGNYRHAVICVTDHDPSFARRIQRADVAIHELHKKPGQDPAVWWRLFKLLRRLKPDLVHTRNLSAMEALLPAFLAGVPARVHSEHGYDLSDPDGSNKTYRRLRRLLSLLAQRIIPLSQDLERYLAERVGVPRRKLVQLYNGVDATRFHPEGERLPRAGLLPALPENAFLMGTVGRMQAIKDTGLLVEAFIRLHALRPDWRGRLGLVLAGDGPLRAGCEARIAEAGLADAACFAGERGDVPELMRSLDLFVLPSRAEGISNTILEAMACGLPVLATAVGGNAELVQDGVSGSLVPARDADALARAMAVYLDDTALAKRQGLRGRERIEERFSLDSMLNAYDRVYQALLRKD